MARNGNAHKNLCTPKQRLKATPNLANIFHAGDSRQQVVSVRSRFTKVAAIGKRFFKEARRGLCPSTPPSCEGTLKRGAVPLYRQHVRE